MNRKKATISDAMLKDLQSRSPNLHILHLDHCNNDNLSVMSLPSSLTSLSITHCTWQPRWFKGNKNLPNLISLDVSSTTRIDNYDLMDFVENFEYMEKLCVKDCYRIKDKEFLFIAQTMQRIKYLDLSVTGIGELAIHHLSRHCRQIEVLLLRKCANVNNSCLEEISSGLKNLITLDLSDCSSISFDGLKTLSILNNLKTIIIQGNVNLKDNEVLEAKNMFVQEDLTIIS